MKKNIVANLLALISILFLVWLFISCIEVILLNSSLDPVYTNWNLIWLIFGR